MSTLLIVDPHIVDYATLLGGISPDTEVLILDPNRDGVLQIADYLAGKSGYAALHILSHGSEGALYLGSTVLNKDNIQHYQLLLNTLGISLAESGDLLLYGCNVGAGEAGKAFVKALAQLTGADVGASEDASGVAALGGDWNLEIIEGSVESPLIGISAYEGLLADTTAPTLSSLTIPTSVNLSSGNAGLTISGTASDDISGVKQVVVWFDKGISSAYTLASTSFNTNPFLGNFGLSDSWSDGVSSQTYNIAATNPNGIYNVTSVAVSDVQGNSRTYSASELTVMGVNAAVLFTDGTYTPPTISVAETVSSGKVVLALSASQWSSSSNTISFSISYDPTVASWSQSIAGSIGSYVTSTSVTEVGQSCWRRPRIEPLKGYLPIQN